MDCKNSENEGFLVEDSNVGAHLTRYLNESRKNGEFCDFVVIIEEIEFPCHKCVLSAISSYFNTLFHSSFKESNEDRIVIHGHSSAMFATLLQYMYTGKVKYKDSEIASAFEAAVFFGLDSLTEILAKYMEKNLTPSTVLDSFFAIEHRSVLNKTLKTSIVQCIKEYFPLVARTDKFLEIPFELLLDVVSSDNVYVTKEEEVFDAIERWIKFDKQKRMIHAPELLKTIRYNQLEKSFLVNIMLTSEIVQNMGDTGNEILKDIQNKPSQKRHMDKKIEGKSAYIFYHPNDASGVKPLLFDGNSISSLNWMYPPLHRHRKIYSFFTALSKEAVYVYFDPEKELIHLNTTDTDICSWRKLNTIVNTAVGYGVSGMTYFQGNNKLYFFMRKHCKCFEYDCTRDSWVSWYAFSEEGDFMLSSDQNGLFALNREAAHSWAGYRNVLYFCDPRIGYWAELSPLVSELNPHVTDFTVINDKVYALLGNKICIYDWIANKWNRTGEGMEVHGSRLFRFNDGLGLLRTQTKDHPYPLNTICLYSFNVDQISNFNSWKSFHKEGHLASFSVAAL